MVDDFSFRRFAEQCESRILKRLAILNWFTYC